MARRDSTPILLAEDDENDVVMFRRASHHANLTNPLLVVNDGNEVIAYLSGEGKYADRKRFPMPGLLLLDLKMPGRDGFEVLEWVRGRQELRDLQVVVLTASDQFRDINRSFELGANSFLVKPAEFDEFVGMVEALRSYCLRVWQASDRARGQLSVGADPVGI
jgi:CheY-like chemotaxis protein